MEICRSRHDFVIIATIIIIHSKSYSRLLHRHLPLLWTWTSRYYYYYFCRDLVTRLDVLCYILVDSNPPHFVFSPRESNVNIKKAGAFWKVVMEYGLGNIHSNCGPPVVVGQLTYPSDKFQQWTLLSMQVDGLPVCGVRICAYSMRIFVYLDLPQTTLCCRW